MRSKRPFRRAELWRWLRKNPGSRRCEIVAGTKISNPTVGHMLGDMRRCGQIRFEGRNHAARWYVVGDEPPVDMRGLSEGTQRSLAEMDTWRVHLPLAFKARGIEWRARFSQCAEAKVMFQSRRDTAPERNVSIPSLADLCGALMKD